MRSRNRMPGFRLYTSVEMVPHVDRWAGMALDNHVEELSLTVLNPGCRSDSVPYISDSWTGIIC